RAAARALPFFLRSAGLKDSERLRVARDKALELHQAVRKWTDHLPVNLPYVDLLFAFALGKLGETTPARKLLEAARQEMDTPLPAAWQDGRNFEACVAGLTKRFLYKAFRYRVEQVMAGKPHTGQMSAELLAELDELTRKAREGPTNNPHMRAEYAIGRMRQQSRILEPQERLDPYSFW